MSSEIQAQNDEHKQSALLYILRRLPSQTMFYGSMLGAIAVAGGMQIPPGLEAVGIGIGVNILSGIIEGIARKEQISDEEIVQRVEQAIAGCDFQHLLTEGEFQRNIAKLVRRLDLIKFSIKGNEFEVTRQLVQQYSQHQAILAEIADSLVELVRDYTSIREQLSGLSTRQQSDVMIEMLQKILDTSPNQAERISSLISAISDLTNRQLQMIRFAWQEGRRDEVILWIETQKQNISRWNDLAPEVKAEITCFEASIIFERGDVEQSEKLLDKAHSFAHLESETRIRALIAYLKSGPDTALSIVEGLDDIDTQNLKAIILLESGRIDEARTIVQADPSRQNDKIETIRVRALLHLADRNISQARNAIEDATKLAPRWRSVQFVAAVIHYFSALSPAVLPGRLVSVPEPIDWMLVKQDNESCQHLDTAKNILVELAEKAEGEERFRLRTWLLACLANHPDHQLEASELCCELLAENPLHSLAIVWGLARHYDIDVLRSQREIETAINEYRATSTHIMALTECYKTSRNLDAARTLLANSRLVFQQYNEDVLWGLTYIPILLSLSDVQTAKTVLENLPLDAQDNESKALELLILSVEADDWLPLAAHWRAQFETTGNALSLLEYCSLMSRHEDWGGIAEYSKELAEKIDTEQAYVLAINATYQAKHYDLCRELIRMYGEANKSSRFSRNLSLFHINILEITGDLKGAISEAEILARTFPEPDVLITLARLYHLKGDLKSLAILARQFREQPGTETSRLLGLANLIKDEDISLAQELWRQAVSSEMPDDLVPSAIGEGFQLALESEIEHLSIRLQELGQQQLAGVQALRLSEMPAFFAQLAQTNTQHLSSYDEGSIPIHYVAAQLNIPLVDLYHTELVEKENNPSPCSTSYLLARHGGHFLDDNFPSVVPNWRLSLDITAILLAAHLELLDKVERVFRPLRISPDLIPALIEMKGRIRHPQTSRLSAYEQIVELTDKQALHTEDCPLPSGHENSPLIQELGVERYALLNNAQSTQGFFADFLPLRKQGFSEEVVTLPEDIIRYIVDCRTIADVLHDYQAISERVYSKALDRLGTLRQSHPSAVRPALGAHLFCCTGIVDVLADADLLQAACQHFKVHITTRELDEAQRSLHQEKRAATTSAWLQVLVDRLSRGIDDGKYEILPLTSHDVHAEETPRHADVNCLLSLIQNSQASDVLWIDDRNMNSFGGQIVGINEILKILVGAKVISLGEYYEYLQNLRAANIRYIPVQSDEILYHLTRATIEKGVLIETPALSILRRYVAACLYSCRKLQILPVPENIPNKQGETAYIIGLNRALLTAFLEVWKLPENENFRWVRAEWLRSNLYLDYPALCLNKLDEPEASQTNQYRMAAHFAALISQAISQLPGIGNNEREIRHFYFDWLFSRILYRKFEIEPYLLKTTAAILKDLLLNTKHNHLENIPEDYISRWLRVFVGELPPTIQQELQEDRHFMAEIGFDIEALEAKHDQFWKAMTEAVNGHATEAYLSEIKAEVILYSEEHDGQVDVLFDNPLTGEKTRIAEDNLALLSDSPEIRENSLRSRQFWFDCSAETFEQLVAQVGSADAPQGRMELTDAQWNISALRYYGNLLDILRQNSPATFRELLPPGIESLCRHLRIANDNTRPFQEKLNQAAQVLLNEERIFITLNRFVGLPVSLPDALVKAFLSLSFPERHGLIKQLLRRTGSPISQIHLLHLLTICQEDAPAYLRLIRWLIREIVGPGWADRLSAFSKTIRWVNREFQFLPEFKDRSEADRLAIVWTHAHHLFAILSLTGRTTTVISEMFSQVESRELGALIERDSAYWFDVSHPERVKRGPFLLAGLHYALGESVAQIITPDLQPLIMSALYEQVEDALPLLQAWTQHKDSLGSFLFGDLGDKSSVLLGNKDLVPFREADMRTNTETALSQLLEKPDDFEAWMTVHAIITDLPIYGELASNFKSMVQQTNFSDLFKKRVELGIIALQTATLQAITLADERVRQYLITQLFEIAQLLAQGDFVTETETMREFIQSGKILFTLVDHAFNMSVAGQSHCDFAHEFVGILGRLTEIWSPSIKTHQPVARNLQYLIQALCDELPIEQAQLFWPLLLQFRSE